jgi:lysozyme family protein
MFQFSALKDDYTRALSALRLTRQNEVDYVVQRRVHPISLIAAIDGGMYDEGCHKTGVPIAWAAASFEREASSNFYLSPAQGDPLSRMSFHVPRGLGPYPRPGREGSAWTQAQEDAYRIDHLDLVGEANWIIERALYEGEVFNGFGPRMHGRQTGYLYSGTSIYTGGKYVADGVWSSTEDDKQLGIVPMMLRIIQLRPQLTFVGAHPVSAPTDVVAPPLVPEVEHNAFELQAVMNHLVNAGLVVDGNYGRHTRNAVRSFQSLSGLTLDGIAGSATWAAIEQKLSSMNMAK